MLHLLGKHPIRPLRPDASMNPFTQALIPNPISAHLGRGGHMKKVWPRTYSSIGFPAACLEGSNEMFIRCLLLTMHIAWQAKAGGKPENVCSI